METGVWNLYAGSGTRHEGPYVAVRNASVSAGAGSWRPSSVVVPSGKICSRVKGVRIYPIRWRRPPARNPPNTSRPRTDPSASTTSTLNAMPL